MCTTILNSIGRSYSVYPNTPLFAYKGALYGALTGRFTYGKLFKINPSLGDERLLYSFPCCSYSNLGPVNVNDNAIFGVSSAGAGGGQGLGDIYRFDLSTGTMTILYSFTGAQDGAVGSNGVGVVIKDGGL